MKTLICLALGFMLGMPNWHDGADRPGEWLDKCFACAGCYAQPTSGTAGGLLVITSEPNFGNGTCTGTPNECVAASCTLSGTLSIRNVGTGTIYWSTDGGRTRVALPSGSTLTVEFGPGSSPACSKDGDKELNYTFYSSATPGVGLIAGAFYKLVCSKCNG